MLTKERVVQSRITGVTVQKGSTNRTFTRLKHSTASCNLRVQGGVNVALSPIFRYVNFKAVRVDPHFSHGSAVTEGDLCPSRWPGEASTVSASLILPQSLHALLSNRKPFHPENHQWNDGKQTENRSTLMGDVADSENAEKLRPGKGN